MYARVALRDAALLGATLAPWAVDASSRQGGGPAAAGAGAAVLERPPCFRVLRGDAIPRGLGYRTADS
jgi:hypothetical protein